MSNKPDWQREIERVLWIAYAYAPSTRDWLSVVLALDVHEGAD